MDSDRESSVSENSIENEENYEEELPQEEKDKIKQELTTMSFEDLQKLKEKLGAKIYNATVFGVSSKNKPQTSFKRANKNRPREMSSKHPIKIQKEIVQVKKQKPRDPRFDPLCGNYDEKIFKSNYKFVNEVRKNERDRLKKELAETEDEKQKKKLTYLIQRMNNKILEQEKRDLAQAKERAEKAEIKETLKRGEKPTYKKKSEKKIENLVYKFEELKKNNKLQKHIEKRSKKLTRRDRENLDTFKR